MPNNSLRIMEWNANGLLRHRDELQVILNIEKIDICLISETHFTSESFFQIENFKVYHTMHPSNTARGGSAILIRNNIRHHEEEKYATNHLQATSVSILSTKQTITVTAIYNPPRFSISTDEYLSFFRTLNHHFIIGGDFNAKHTQWGSRLTTTKGRELYQAAVNYGCKFVSTGKPTYWPTDIGKTPDLIDFFVLKNISSNYLDINEGCYLNSDHSPIILTLSEYIIKKEYPPSLTNKLTDWRYFNTLLTNMISLNVPLKSTEQIEDEVQNFTEIIQEAAWKSTPKMKHKYEGINFPKEIRTLIQEKRKLRKRWHRTRSREDKNKLNQANALVSREIRNHKNSMNTNFLKNLTPYKDTEYSLFKTSKHLKRPITHIPPIKMPDAQWARSSESKAKVFAEHLEHRFLPNPGSNDLPNVPKINSHDEIPYTTLTEIKDEIKQLKIGKAPGFDLITGMILKNMCRKGLLKLTNIINAAIRLKYVPSAWKVSEIIMIPKPGKNHTLVESYRPIALLPIMSKLYEKLIASRLRAVMDKYDLIPNHQFGFRCSHSTIDQVHRITNVIEKSLEEKMVCSALFLDMAQAFDRVWHTGLLHKLNSILPESYYRLLVSYLETRKFRTKVEDSYSELKNIQAGIPQGSVLGPILYTLYVNDVPNEQFYTLATYADDTALLTVAPTADEATTKLEIAAENIVAWASMWRIKLNETKSIYINFTNKHCNRHTMTLNGTTLKAANTAKYLGMTLDTKLQWKPHIKMKQQELQIKFRSLYWLLGRNSELSLSNKIVLYKSVLRPIWTYGVQLWGCAKKSNIDIIQRSQNSIIRKIIDAPWYARNGDLHREFRVETVNEIISKYSTSHQHRIQLHVNEEVTRLANSQADYRRLKRKKPYDLAISSSLAT